MNTGACETRGFPHTANFHNQIRKDTEFSTPPPDKVLRWDLLSRFRDCAASTQMLLGLGCHLFLAFRVVSAGGGGGGGETGKPKPLGNPGAMWALGLPCVPLETFRPVGTVRIQGVFVMHSQFGA